MAKPRFTKAKVRAALEATGGLQARAAERLGCHPRTILRFLNKYPDLENIRRDAHAALGDTAEDGLRKLIEKGHAPTIRWYLATKHPDRGYRRSVALEGVPDGPPIRTETKVNFDGLSSDAIAAIDAVAAELDGESGGSDEEG